MNDSRHDTESEYRQEPAKDEERNEERDDEQRPLNSWQIVFSTLAAAFGVQSSRNRERDFTRGKAIHFIIAGIVFTAVFVLLVVLVVRLVLSTAGA
ncbi:MAG: DUF2970 domain-containing protein [Pseudomonadota bacterium]